MPKRRDTGEIGAAFPRCYKGKRRGPEGAAPSVW
ncbi:hypothetical protein TP2_04050 [Thioclava pacifica DSM 10166]|uniref:Uncharacterized protein n=1 Tax=Thioclava pacifica DSM 10166 TaxID=1353537 RepID=A0A074JEY5_9RHOB|nr:hypothetical protein TP2_04050 [Thioclava pacifica DSM 10166]